MRNIGEYCRKLAKSNIKTEITGGDHIFFGNGEKLAQIIVEHISKVRKLLSL